MAEEAHRNVMEQCMLALTSMANNSQTSQRTRIEREIQYLSPFDGEPGTLPAFMGAVDRILAEHPANQAEVYNIIFNNKIRGAARNVLGVNQPANWETCKVHLKQHYKASKNQLQLTKEINNIQVSSIEDLEIKVKKIVEDITEFAAFEDNGDTMLEIFSGMLVQIIKGVAAGAFAFAIMRKTNLREIRAIINEFVGQDEGNLKSKFCKTNTTQFQQNFPPNSRYNSHYRPNFQHNNQNRQNAQQYYNYNNPQNNYQYQQTHQNTMGNRVPMSQNLSSNNFNQQNQVGNLPQNTNPFKQRFNNNSGQSRRSHTDQPMDVDNLTNGRNDEDIFFQG